MNRNHVIFNVAQLNDAKARRMGRAQRNPSSGGAHCDGFRLSPLPILRGLYLLEGLDHQLEDELTQYIGQHCRKNGEKHARIHSTFPTPNSSLDGPISFLLAGTRMCSALRSVRVRSSPQAMASFNMTDYETSTTSGCGSVAPCHLVRSTISPASINDVLCGFIVAQGPHIAQPWGDPDIAASDGKHLRKDHPRSQRLRMRRSLSCFSRRKSF